MNSISFCPIYVLLEWNNMSLVIGLDLIFFIFGWNIFGPEPLGGQNMTLSQWHSQHRTEGILPHTTNKLSFFLFYWFLCTGFFPSTLMWSVMGHPYTKLIYTALWANVSSYILLWMDIWKSSVWNYKKKSINLLVHVFQRAQIIDGVRSKHRS